MPCVRVSEMYMACIPEDEPGVHVRIYPILKPNYP